MTLMDSRIVFIFATCAYLVSSQSFNTYTGTCSTTVNNKACQRWDSQTPHGHTNNNPLSFPYDDDMQSAANHCRDPDNTGYLWCYTLDPNTRYERCKKDEECPINVSPYCVGQHVVGMCNSSSVRGPTVSIDTGEILRNKSASCNCYVSFAEVPSDDVTIAYRQDRGGGTSTMDFCGYKFTNTSLDKTCKTGVGYKQVQFNSNGNRTRGCLTISSSVNMTVTCYPADERPIPTTAVPDTVTTTTVPAVTGVDSATTTHHSSQSPPYSGTTARPAAIYSASTDEIDLAVVIGCSVGGILILAIIIFGVIFCRRNRKQREIEGPVKENGNAAVDMTDAEPAIEYGNYPQKNSVVEDPEYIMTPNELYGSGFEESEPSYDDEIQPTTPVNSTSPKGSVLYSSVMNVEVRDNRVELYANLSDDEEDVGDIGSTYTPAVYSVVHKQN